MNNQEKRRTGIQTQAIHSGDAHNPTTAVASPIYQSATYGFDDTVAIAAAMQETAAPQFYGRYGSPNTKQVEATVAALEGAEAALAVGSGMAAVTMALFTFLQQGDHVIGQTTMYPSTVKMLEKKLPKFGIEATLVDQTDVAAFAAAIRPNTKLIYVETPANPTLRLTDLAAVADLARAHGILTVADNTFASPFNQRPLALGIDLVLHSATKYLAGHSDVIAGVIAGSAEHVTRMWETNVLFGPTLHPMEAWLLERGLKTYGVRLAAHNENACRVAAFLEGHTAVERVYYPGLTSHSQHALARRQMVGGFGGMVCFELKGGLAAGRRMLERIQLVRLAVSLGGVHSLMTHPASTISAIGDEASVKASGVHPGLIRLSVGLETGEDIVADLAQALG